MGAKIIIKINIFVSALKKNVKHIIAFFRWILKIKWPRRLMYFLGILALIIFRLNDVASVFQRVSPSYYDRIFPSSSNKIINNSYTTSLVLNDHENILCDNFFNSASLPEGIDQFIYNGNRFKLKNGISYAELICNKELPVNFCARVEFVPRGNNVINFGLSEKSSLNYGIFRIIIGDSGNTSVVIKDKDDKNIKIKYYSDNKYAEKLSLKDPINLNQVVKLHITQRKILNGQVELSIALDYTPIGDTIGRLVTANLEAIVEDINYSSDSKYLIGIGMYKGAAKEAVEIEFLNFQVKEFTI